MAVTSGRDIKVKEASNEMQNFVTDGQVLTDIIHAQQEDAKINMEHARREDDEVDAEEKDNNGEEKADDDDEEKHKKKKGKACEQLAPELNVFFTPDDLKIGKKMPIYLVPLTLPKFLPREESEKIPFSSKHLPFLLQKFSVHKHSIGALAMKYTLQECEKEPMNGETKFCATSPESLHDFAGEIFGPNSQLKALSTTHHTNCSPLLQNYTISHVKNISVPTVVWCHPLPYPYAVFYCHSLDSATSVFVVVLEGEDGARVEAPAICHMDTSKLDKDDLAFDVLKVQPGTSPVCVFLPPDNLVWVPLTSAL